MKKGIIFLMICLLVGMSVGFAEGLPPHEPMELDWRVKVIEESPGSYRMGNRFEDAIFLQDGGIAFQIMKTTELTELGDEGLTETKLHLYSGKIDGPYTSQECSYTTFDEPFGTSFFVQGSDGILYFSNDKRIYAVDAELQTEAQAVFSEMVDSYLVESRGESLLFFNRPSFKGDSERSALHIVRAEAGHKLSEKMELCYAFQEEIIEEMNAPADSILAIDFAETENAIYALIDTEETEKFLEAERVSAPTGARYQIVRLDMTFDTFLNSIDFVETNRISIQGEFDSKGYMGMQFNGTDFVLSCFGETKKEIATRMMRVDETGLVYDTIKLPGLVNNFDVMGDRTLATVVSPYDQDQGLYLIDWNKREAQGGPRALIAERTMHGKTMAIFRDQGYGLLRKEEAETGVIDYLAPLKTEESNVTLRIPLCDVTAKLAEDVRYLEIMFGEDRIDIPMDSLDVRDLLAQLPCETDATIEFHLTREEEGEVAVTADLFVVEEVDARTKVVHRVPIALP